MYETRHQFIETMRGCERETLAAFSVALRAVDRAVAVVDEHDIALAKAIIADDVALDRAHMQVNECIVRAIATQAPVAEDLRMLTALLDAIRRIERIGDQCANVAKLIPLSGAQPKRDPALVELVTDMGRMARSCAADARDTFELRSIQGFVPECEEVARLGNQVMRQAVAVGADRDTREWAMHMVLAARAFGRIADNGRAIGGLVPFVVSGTRVQFVRTLESV